MPEGRELMAQAIHLKDSLHTMSLIASSPQWLFLKSIYADTVGANNESLRPDDPMYEDSKQGLAVRLRPGNAFVRGQTHRQTRLCPPTKGPDEDSPDIPWESLELKDVDFSGRALYLDFGPLYLKFSPLTHTSLQLYSYDQWNSIRSVPKASRGFKVAIAFQFEDFVLAFLSYDLVFQPEWFYKSLDVVLSSLFEPSPLNDVRLMLGTVADWTLERRTSTTKRDGLACEAMRKAQDVWHGLGVYSICEVFFKAGVSMLLSEKDVFDCPSRTARLCAAFYSFMWESREYLPALLQKSMQGTVIAPTIQHRLKYNDWLHIFGKELTQAPQRMAQLVKEYLHTGGQFDAFDPFFIRAALLYMGPYADSIGKLIFGASRWQLIRPAELELSNVEDPLTVMSRIMMGIGKVTDETHLKPDAYQELFPPMDAKVAYIRSYAYRPGKGRKIIWSVTPWVPSCGPVPFQEIVGESKYNLLFTTIVRKDTVAIGPLEYCGHGKMLKCISGKQHLALSAYGDPNLTEAQIRKRAQGIFRKKKNLDARGSRKTAMTDRQRKDQHKFVEESVLVYRRAKERLAAMTGIVQIDSPPPCPSPSTKKRRRSQDKQLALPSGDEEDVQEEEMPRKRRRVVLSSLN